MDENQFSDAIAVLTGIYGEITQGKIRVYWQFLNDLTTEELVNAIGELVRGYKYKTFPSVADIRYYAGKDLESVSKDAIAKLKRLAQSKSSYPSVCFSDKTLNAVASQYAKWSEMSAWTGEEWGYNYKRLVDLYSEYKRSGIGAERIVGYDEEHGLPFKIRFVQEIGLPIKVIPHKEEKLLERIDK